MDKWIGTVAALVGVLLGGLISYTTTSKQLQQQIRIERQRLDIEKMEELHTKLSRLELSYRTMDRAASNPAEKLEKELDIPIDRIKMLVGFYAPELNPDVEHLEQLSDEFTQDFADVVVWTTKKVPRADIEEEKKKMNTDYEAVKQQCHLMQSKVVDMFQRNNRA